MAELIQGPVASFLLLQAARIRAAKTVEELDFVLLNETRNFLTYRSAGIWRSHRSMIALSGMAVPDPNAPYLQWLNRIGTTLARYGAGQALIVEAEMLAPADAGEWHEWLPDAVAWRGFGAVRDPHAATTAEGPPPAEWGVVFAREEPWSPEDLVVINEATSQWLSARLALMAVKGPTLKDYWAEACAYWPDRDAWRRWGAAARTLPRRLVASPQAIGRGLRTLFRGAQAAGARLADARREAGWKGVAHGVRAEGRRLWREQRRLVWGGLALALLLPVRMTVLAPAELVPSNPIVIRSPVDGIIDHYFVSPNTLVQPGQLLVQLDLTSLLSREKVSGEELAIAQAEYRQSNLQSLSDPKARMQLQPLEARVEEKRAEAELASSLLQRSRITAPQAGLVLFDEPSELAGKPVSAGERLLVLAQPDQVEIEVWLPLNDAIALSPGDEASLYLNARPFSPVRGTIRYIGYEPVRRPDASYAYRVRAAVKDASGVRIGLKGTARLYGEYVPLVYWALRKPIAWVRYTLAI